MTYKEATDFHGLMSRILNADPTDGLTFIYGSSRLWNRYLSKVKQEIQTFYNNHHVFFAGTGIVPVTKSILRLMYHVGTEEKITSPLVRILSDKRDDTEFNEDIMNYSKVSMGQLLLFFCDIGSSFYLKGETTSKAFDDTFLNYVQHMSVNQTAELFDIALIIVCRRFIAHKALNGERLTEENYVTKCMPRKQKEIWYIVRAVNACLADIVAICVSKTANFDVDTAEIRRQLTDAQEALQKSMEKNIKLTGQVQELERKSEDLSAKYQRTQRELSVFTSQKIYTQAEYNDLQQKYQDVIQKYNKLQKVHNALDSRYQSLKETISDIEEQPEESEEIPQEPEKKVVDLHKRYLFISDIRTNYKKTLLEAFPNAEFLTSTREAVPDQVDLAIIITTCVKHALCYYAESRCRALNIPMIYCKNTNIDLIIEEISKVI